jgi:hypothetical protein
MRKFSGKRLLVVLFLGLMTSLLFGAIAVAQDAETTPEPEAVGIIDAATDAASGVTGAAGDIWAQLIRTPTSDVARILMIIGGIVLLVAGWYVYEWIILIAGFLIGASTALALAPDADTIIAILVFILGGIIGAALGALLYYIAVFLMGGYIGILVTQGLALALGLTPVTLIPIIIGFLIGGFLLVVLSQELLVIFSAIVGAQLIALALNLSFPWQIMLVLVGIIVQLVALRVRGDDIRRRPLRRPLWTRREVVE